MSSHSTEAAEATEFEPKRELARIEESCATVCREAKSKGADEVEAFASTSSEVSVNWENGGKLKLAQVEQGTSLGVRVHKSDRLGFSSTNQMSASDLRATCDDALELASVTPPEKVNRLLPGSAISPSPACELWRPEFGQLSVEEAVALGRSFVDSCVESDPRISVDVASFTVWQGAQAVRSTTGAEASEADAGLSFSIMGMAVDGDDVGGFHYTGDFVRDRKELEAAFERARTEFVNAAIGNLGAGAAESYSGPVLFSPAAFASVFLQPFLAASSALAVQRERSALRGKLGESVASTALTLIDDPTDRGLAGAGSFDREGAPTSKRTLLDRGVLKTHLYNGLAARTEELAASTGHAAGGARSLPGISCHALCVAPGDGGSKSDLLKALGRGLYVERFSGSVDAASGDFSGVAKSARWVENGEIVRPVTETLLAGNSFDLLKGSLVLGSEAERRGGSARIPAALVDGIDVTAG